MTNVNLAPLPKLQFSQNGVPLAGGKLFTYAAGTMNKQTTYTDSTGAAPNTNPIVLDANGQCDCWLLAGTAYKLILSPSTDTDPPTNPYWTEDNVRGINDTASSYAVDTGTTNNYVVSLTPAPNSYTDGMVVRFRAANTNSGPSVLNVSGLLALAITLNGLPLLANQILAGSYYEVIYSSSAGGWLLMSASSNASLVKGPAFKTTGSTATTLAANVAGKMMFDQVSFDTNGCYDHVTNYRFTPNVPGYYFIQASLGFGGATVANPQFVTYFYKNGASYADPTIQPTTQYQGAMAATLMEMNGTTDYVECWCRQEVSSSQPVYADEFSGFLARPL